MEEAVRVDLPRPIHEDIVLLQGREIIRIRELLETSEVSAIPHSTVTGNGELIAYMHYSLVWMRFEKRTNVCAANMTKLWYALDRRRVRTLNES